MRTISVAARASPLSQAQVAEIESLLPETKLIVHFVETFGDLDRTTSLRDLGKSDFFTREIDELLLDGKVRAAIHSAKDLPDPLPEGLFLAALSSGADPRDALVLRPNESIFDLSDGALIATSSERREEAVKKLRSNLCFCDIRGTIQERLDKLKRGEVDGVVIAEAAIVRLGLASCLNRWFLPDTSAEHQGRLAIVVRQNDREAAELFASVDARGKERPWTILHLGLNPAACPSKGRIYHYPVIRIQPLSTGIEEVKRVWDSCSHVILTSKETIALLPSFEGKTVIAIGKKTAMAIKESEPLIAPYAEQEGVIELLESLDLSKAAICYPRSSLARPNLADYLRKKNIRSHVIDLYETVFQQPGAPPSLDEIDEIVFTSPSTAEGFRRIYGEMLPQGKKITLQGRITASEKLFATTHCKTVG